MKNNIVHVKYLNEKNIQVRNSKQTCRRETAMHKSDTQCTVTIQVRNSNLLVNSKLQERNSCAGRVQDFMWKMGKDQTILRW